VATGIGANLGVMEGANVPCPGLREWNSSEVGRIVLAQVPAFSAERAVASQPEILAVDIQQPRVAVTLLWRINVPEPIVLGIDSALYLVGAATEAPLRADVEVITEENPGKRSVDDVVQRRSETLRADDGVIVEDRVNARGVHIDEALPVIADVERYAQVVDFLNHGVMVGLPTGLQEAGVALAVVVVDVDVPLVVSTIVQFDGAAVGAVGAVERQVVLDGVIGDFLVADAELNTHRPPCTGGSGGDPKSVARAVHTILGYQGELAGGLNGFGASREGVVANRIVARAVHIEDGAHLEDTLDPVRMAGWGCVVEVESLDDQMASGNADTVTVHIPVVRVGELRRRPFTVGCQDDWFGRCARLRDVDWT